MGILSTAARDVYDMAFQISPIILTGGIASNIAGGALPIVGLMGSVASVAQGIITNGASLQDFPFRFVPLPGSTPIQNSVATYPFANRKVAANAVIEEPKRLSMRMIAPVNTQGGYLTKLAIFTSLVDSIQTHIDNGGTFTVATPSMLWTDLLLLTISDVTGSETKQQQTSWQWDFFKPLITQAAAKQALGGLANAMQGGSKITSPSWSGSINSAIGGVTGAYNAGIGGVIGQIGRVL